MMSKICNSKIACVIWSLILEKISFLISGVMACIVILRLNNYILGAIIAGGVGGLLFGLLHWKHKMIGRMTITGLIAVPIGLLGSFALVEGLVGGFGLLFPSVAAYFENSSIADIIAIILMGIIFGVIFGATAYGRKSIRLFSAACGAVSIPIGFLVGSMNSGYWVKVWLENLFHIFGKIDLNFLMIITGFGIGLGLSMGLYSMAKQRR